MQIFPEITTPYLVLGERIYVFIGTYRFVGRYHNPPFCTSKHRASATQCEKVIIFLDPDFRKKKFPQFIQVTRTMRAALKEYPYASFALINSATLLQ